MTVTEARRVALLAVGPDAEAAWGVLAALPGIAPTRVPLDALSSATFLSAAVLWVHATVEPPPLPRAPLVAWLEAGGRLLLTQRAAASVAALGLEPDSPNDVVTRIWRHADDELWFPEFRAHRGFPHVRGLAAWGPHPLFAGFGQGTYTWAPQDGERVSQATYARGRRPARGRVVACERSYIHLNADRIVAWEYAVGAGGVLCVGAFVVPAAREPRLAPQLGALLGNALAGDAIPHASRAGVATVWPVPHGDARPDATLGAPPPPSLDGALPDLGSPLLWSSRALADEALTLAGRRVLVVGGELSGVREVWTHPWRALADLRVTIGGSTPLVRDAQIAPTLWQRHLVSPARIVEETVTTALEQPIVLLEYRAEKIGRARGLRVAPELMLDWTTDLRRAWPYDAASTDGLRWLVTADGRTLVIRNGAGAAAVVVASRPVEWAVAPAAERVAVQVTLRAALEEPLRLALVAAGSAAERDATLRALGRRGVTALAAQRTRHEREVRDGAVRLRSPDPAFDAAVEWAKHRLDAFLVDTPGVGRGLVAGYAASRPGWGDGRPGYAWYFGRDACWSALALLAAGDFTTPRLVLRHLADTQDVTGKVIHELTTSGLAHYDAADSTPLFLLLAGRYAAWTGDHAFLGGLWPRLEHALRFCLATDTDGDGLIENTAVGHGWIEMGPLSGAHVTLYLASLWIAALEALAPVAAALGHDGAAADLAARARRARTAVDRRFRTADGYALGILADGTRQDHRTALLAVPLLLGAVDPAPAARWFDAITSPAFSAPWGVRLLPTSDAAYDPTGYHSGAVWPLYTGWASLAEYAHHHADAGWRHLAANARLPFARAHGAFDEVLRGDEERTAGVCPDQAWSAAMVLAPLIEGMLGAGPDAPHGRLTLTPHLPAHWDECEWCGLRVGATALDVRVARRAEHVRVRLARTAGPALAVTVAAPVPRGRRVTEARADEAALQARPAGPKACPHAAVTLAVGDVHDVEMWFA